MSCGKHDRRSGLGSLLEHHDDAIADFSAALLALGALFEAASGTIFSAVAITVTPLGVMLGRPLLGGVTGGGRRPRRSEAKSEETTREKRWHLTAEAAVCGCMGATRRRRLGVIHCRKIGDVHWCQDDWRGHYCHK